MGRSRTSKYAIEMDGVTSSCWFVNEKGRPTEENLAEYVSAYVESLKVGGCNYHVSKALGFMPIPNWARIVLNDGSRKPVVEWKAPMFMVI
jgi:hypothetical protein